MFLFHLGPSGKLSPTQEEVTFYKFIFTFMGLELIIIKIYFSTEIHLEIVARFPGWSTGTQLSIMCCTIYIAF